MKKLQESLRVDLRARYLYLDDVEAIFNMVNELYPGSVKIASDTIEFDSLDELSKLPNEVTELDNLTLSAPAVGGHTVNVRLARHGWFQASDSSAAHFGLVTRIESVCRKPRAALSAVNGRAQWSLLAAFLVFTALGSFTRNDNFSYAAVVSMSLAFALIIRSGWVTFYAPVIFRRRRSEDSSFWKRQRDHIEKAMATAVITLFVGIILGGTAMWFITGALNKRNGPTIQRVLIVNDAGAVSDH